MQLYENSRLLKENYLVDDREKTIPKGKYHKFRTLTKFKFVLSIQVYIEKLDVNDILKSRSP